MPTRACSANAALRVCTIGYFQPDKGQFGCISCDILGDFYQELSAQSSCVACPPSTKRFIGVLTAATKSSCQCKEGAIFATCPRWLACTCICVHICARRFQRALPPQGTTTRDSRPARFVALAIDRFRALPAMSPGLQECAKCTRAQAPIPVASPSAARTLLACLVWSRPCVCEQVQSAFHVLAG